MTDLPIRVSGPKRKAGEEIDLYVFSCLQLDQDLTTIICHVNFISNRPATVEPILKKAKRSALPKVSPSLSHPASGLLPLWAKSRPESVVLPPKSVAPPKVPARSIASTPDPFALFDVELAGGDSNDDEEQRALTCTKPALKPIRKKIPTTSLEESNSDFPKVSNIYSKSSIQLPILVVFQSLVHIHLNSKQADSEGKVRTGVRSTKPKAIKFDNSHLPSGILKRWREMFLPMWREYMGQSSDPWLYETNGVIAAQRLYNKVFDPSEYAPQTLAAEKEPIFSVVWF
jgi:hypothetical protein